jgi:cytoskeletal protein CcmA (bactofilin family)
MEPNNTEIAPEPLDASNTAAPGLSPETSFSSPEPPKKNPRFISRLRESFNIYLVLFFLLIVTGVTATIIALTKGSPKTADKKTATLTSEQLSKLEGSTTIVGESNQTLDVQSNAIFEGQVLVRKDVEVAGSIKVGGGLALSSVTVGGQGNFGQLQINGVLSVAGDTAFSGKLSVKEDLNVAGSGTFGGNLSANQLTISNLSLNGDLKINRHIVISGSVPAKSDGAALGSGGTVSISGSDSGGTITINTGTSPPAGCFVTISFKNQFSSTPHVIISPSNSNAADLSYYTNRSASSFSVCTTSAPSASKTYIFDYIVFN